MQSIDTISADDLDLYIGRKDAVIIDLREREAYEISHLKTAINIPYENLEECRKISRKKLVILYCQRGSASLFAARELMKMGFQVKSVAGGIRCYQGSNLFFSKEHSRIKDNHSRNF